MAPRAEACRARLRRARPRPRRAPPASPWSEVGLPRRARERDDIADVLDPGRVLDRALEPEPEPGVRHGAVTAEVAVPPVRFRVELHLRDAAIEHVEPL